MGSKAYLIAKLMNVMIGYYIGAVSISNLLNMLKRSLLPNAKDEIELMQANLLALQRQITQRSDEDEPLSSSHLRISPSNHQNVQSQQQHHALSSHSHRNLPSLIRDHYEEYLRTRQLPQNHQQKINYLLEERISPGNAVALFQMLHYFKEALAEQTLMEIAGKVFQAFVGAQNQEELICYGQLMAVCGVECQEVCQHVAELMVEDKLDFDLGFVVLSNQGETGLVYLYDIANRDIPSLSSKILDCLSRTDSIVSQLLVPLLIQDVLSQNHPKYKDIALSVLNRIGPTISNAKTVQQLGSLLSDPSIDKRILMATLRSAGAQGEKILLDVVTSRLYSESLVALALSVLSWRVPSKTALRIKAIQFTIQNCFLPGRLYQYEGQAQPWAYQAQPCTDSLCLSSRDFLAQLQIFLKQGAFRRHSSPNNKHMFALVQVLGLEQEEGVQISEEVVRVLAQELKSKSVKVREVALIQLGNIGHPQAALALQAVSKCLWDSDSNIRSAACWTISRICPDSNRKVQARLGELLRDHFWKVRTSACIALGITARRPQNITIQHLLRALQDGSIPKSTVCESLARMGAEELLLELLKGSSKGDFKLREAIISSFQFSTLRSPLINLIVQELLRYSRDARIQTRQLCLLTLNSLRGRVQAKGGESISYFQTKNLLPFYYCFLDDASPRIRTVAAEGILSFGPQAELIFIQGMTKGQPLAKVECIKCLGKLGVQNFRALVLGLRDQDERVKKASINTILGSFTTEQIVEEFKGRENHAISLVCNLTQILKTVIKSEELKLFLREVIDGLNEQRKTGAIRHYNENIRVN